MAERPEAKRPIEEVSRKPAEKPTEVITPEVKPKAHAEQEIRQRIADRIRAKKSDGKNKLYSSIDFGLSQKIYDGALELVAKEVENGTKLGRDNVQVAQYEQLINCKPACISPCAVPAVSFTGITPNSGTYQLRLQYEHYTFIGVGCSGLYVNNPFNSNDLDLYSNSIVVTRPDDGWECPCGTPYDLAVNCSSLNFFHDGLPPFIPPGPYTARAINNLTSNCNISSNGEQVKFISGNKISLTQGFRSGNNFRAYLDNCYDGIIVLRKAKDTDTIECLNKINNDSSSYSRIIGAMADVGSSQTIKQSNNQSEINYLLPAIEIIPNPSHSGIFTIEGGSEKNNITVTNVIGEIVFVFFKLWAPNIKFNRHQYTTERHLFYKCTIERRIFCS